MWNNGDAYVISTNEGRIDWPGGGGGGEGGGVRLDEPRGGEVKSEIWEMSPRSSLSLRNMVCVGMGDKCPRIQIIHSLG